MLVAVLDLVWTIFTLVDISKSTCIFSQSEDLLTLLSITLENLLDSIDFPFVNFYSSTASASLVEKKVIVKNYE